MIRDFDAFVSYSHNDTAKATQLRNDLQATGRYLWQRRSAHIVIDSASMEPASDLPENIRKYLEQSRKLIVLLSPASCRSDFVALEIDYWLNEKSITDVIPVLLSGNTVDADIGELPIMPPNLRSGYSTPPHWIDLRDIADFDRGDSLYSAALTQIASPILGRSPEDIASQDLSVHRRNRALIVISILVLLCITAAAVVGFWQSSINAEEAKQGRLEAERLTVEAQASEESAARQADLATMRALISRSEQFVEESPMLSLALAAEARAATAEPHPDATAAVIAARVAAGRSQARQVGDTWAAHDDVVSELAFAPDGSTLASAGWDGVVRLWDGLTGESVGEPLVGHDDEITAIAFSHNGSMLASGDRSGMIRIWNPATGESVGEAYSASSSGDSVRDIEFTSNGLVAAAASAGILISDPMTGDNLDFIGPGAAVSYDHLAVEPVTNVLAAGSFSQVTLWDPETGEQVGESAPVNGSLSDLGFYPDGSALFTSDRGVTSHWRLDWPLGSTNREIASVALTTDGRRTAVDRTGRLIAAAVDDEIWLLDGETGDRVGAPLVGWSSNVTDLAFNPAADLLAVSASNGTVALYETSEGPPIDQVLSGHDGNVSAVTTLHSPARAASVGEDKVVRIWDAAQAAPLLDATAGHVDSVMSLTFGPDDRVLATASRDWTIRLWDPSTGLPMGRPLEGHATDVVSLAFDAGGESLWSVDIGGGLRHWRVEDGTPIGGTRQVGTPLTFDLAVSPDGSTVAVAGNDAVIQLWDTATDEARGDPLVGHDDDIVALEFSADGETLLSGSTDGTLRTWSMATGEELRVDSFGLETTRKVVIELEAGLAIATSEIGEVIAVNLGDDLSTDPSVALREPNGDHLLAISPDQSGTLFATAGNDNVLRLWDGSTGEEVHALSSDLRIVSVAFSSDGSRLATGELGGGMRLWDTATGLLVPTTPSGHTNILFAVAGSPVDDLLAAGGADGRVVLWNARTGKPTGVVLKGHTDRIRSLDFGPDGASLVSAGDDRTIRVWDPTTGQLTGPPLTGHDERIQSITVANTSPIVASASFDQTVRLWDVAEFEPLGEPFAGHTGRVNAVAFNHDDSVVASGGDDQTVRLWRRSTGEQLFEPLLGHTAAVSSVAFNQDGSLLVSAGEDGSIRFWNPATGDPIGFAMTGHTSAVYSVTFGQGDSFLASAGLDSTVRLWAPWDEDQACDLVRRFVAEQTIRRYLDELGRSQSVCFG